MTSNTIDPNPDSRSAGRRKDPAWKYHSLVNPNDLNTFKCNFCGKLTKGGVYRAKQHLAGGYRNAEICSKCPPHVRDEIIEFMSKKKGKNDFDDMPDFDDIDTLGDDVDDEMDVGAFQNRGKRPMQGQASSMQQKKQRQQQRGPLDLFLSAKPKVSNQKDAKGKQTTIESHVNKELRENACVWFSRWMYEAGIPFNAVNYPSFKPMMEAVGRAGPGMKPPSFHEVRVPYLKKEVEHTKEIMKSHREEWARYGCTIMCDGWKDKRDRSLLNFLVNSPKGSVFIESIDTSSYAKDGMKLYQLLDRFVEEIGEANVVQVVTDNASANVLAGEFLMTKHKNLYWTPCAAHCLDLMLEDIFKIPRLKSTFQKACSVNGYLYSSAQVLNMMRSFTQKREMLRPGKTRFATAFLTLSRFHKQKANLRKMFTSEEWTNSRFAKETRGKQAAQTVLQESFWKNILFALKVSGPLVKVLRVVDNEDKPAMPYIYEAMDRAKEAIAKSFDDESKYEKIFEIIDERWNVQLHRPLHAAGYYLNPAFFYSNESIREDNEVIEGLYACIERLVPTAEVQDKLSKELSFYKNSEGLFGKQICIRGRNQLSPVEWWSQFGTGTPNLQKFAMKICSLTCSSSGCERNWSIFEHPFPLQTNSLFTGSAGGPSNTGTPGSVSIGAVGVGTVPRHVNIHIHTAVGPRTSNAEGVHGEHVNRSGSGDSGQTRVLPVRNVIAAVVPSRPPVTVSSASQTGFSVSQPPADSLPLSNVIAEVNSRIRNFDDNRRTENLAPSGQSENFNVQNTSGAGNGGNNQLTNLADNEGGEVDLSVPTGTPERESQKAHPHSQQTSNLEVSEIGLNSRDQPSSSSVEGSGNWSNRETVLKSADDSAFASRSSQGNDNPEGATAVPLGLGLGGLQPKRRSKQPRSQNKVSDGETSSSSSQNQQTSSNGQLVLQSLASLANRGNRSTPSSGLPPAMGPITESVQMGGQGLDGQQLDAASAMSQVLQSPAFGSLLSGVSQQTGVGSPNVLRNMLEQFTQSPAMRNTVNQIAQQIDGQDLGNMFSGFGRGQGGGFDLTSMVQQMMPVVSQALGGGSTIPQTMPVIDPNPQAQYNERDLSRDEEENDKHSQIDLDGVTQRIEHQVPPEDIFRSIVESATHLYDDRSDGDDLVNQLCSEEGLASEYLEVLCDDLQRRLLGEKDYAGKS